MRDANPFDTSSDRCACAHEMRDSAIRWKVLTAGLDPVIRMRATASQRRKSRAPGMARNNNKLARSNKRTAARPPMLEIAHDGRGFESAAA